MAKATQLARTTLGAQFAPTLQTAAPIILNILLGSWWLGLTRSSSTDVFGKPEVDRELTTPSFKDTNGDLARPVSNHHKPVPTGFGFSQLVQ